MSRREAPQLRVEEIEVYERDVKLRLPFRFGVITLTRAPQVFVRVRIVDPQGRSAWGTSAEMLAPKWFDKNTRLSNEENFDQLRTSLRHCGELYTGDSEFRSAFDLFANHYANQVESCAARQLNSLIAAYGPALIDRAVLDALCRIHGVSFFRAMQVNLPGIRLCELFPDLEGFDFDAFLAGRKPGRTIHARHTIGLLDPITAADQSEGARVNDGLPETLKEVVALYGHTYYKLKVSGQLEADLERMAAVASVLDRIRDPYFVTLDGNEQFDDVQGILDLWLAMEKTPALARLVESTLFIEQPIQRSEALEQEVQLLSARRPVIIDESDQDFKAFLTAREKGYRGVSSKSCKGFYKSLVNLARCETWNREAAGQAVWFLTGEDLSTQAGISVQQDLALVSLLGLDHVERNGHHYVNGMAAVSQSEQQAFLNAHSDLYTEFDGIVRVHIRKGLLEIASLDCVGFATGAEPEWPAMDFQYVVKS